MRLRTQGILLADDLSNREHGDDQVAGSLFGNTCREGRYFPSRRRKLLMLRISRQRRLLPMVLLTGALLLVLFTLAGTRVPATYARTTASSGTAEVAAPAALSNCTTSPCTFKLGVNPGLLSGAFACPAIQKATATITITNRFANNALNDIMTL